ncbi:MAG: riboflavin synthase [Candidatus Eremiobacteraeota bacterium]|nr:riboflavin synthase [Candidatus Eremiobacteraeota bacterium]
MFSGLIGYRGRVIANEERSGGRHLVIAAPEAIADGIQPKDSVAINGVCLTAVSVGKERVAFDVVPETLARSTLTTLHEGDRVNVELSLKMGDRIGGHFVYGHVDATAEIVDRALEGQGYRMIVAIPPSLARYIVEKGYIAVDGVSLTIAATTGNRFEIALIPETAQRTNLGAKQPGELVNLEVDPIARYALGEAPMPTLIP